VTAAIAARLVALVAVAAFPWGCAVCRALVRKWED
jgi:hypothetical protein